MTPETSAIAHIHAREILDSRGSPTIETNVTLANNVTGSASVPSGASTGSKEALELRDGEPRYLGKGVLRAAGNVHDVISARVKGLSALDQNAVDEAMIKLESTDSKSAFTRLGERVQLVGDDLFVTNTRILKEGIDQGIAISVLIKYNQIGTLTETLAAIRMTHAAGYKAVISHG